MRIIAHRGNINGPGNGNTQHKIEQAIADNFDVELDLTLYDGVPWMGHDFPTDRFIWDHAITWALCQKIYIHCKTIQTLQYATSKIKEIYRTTDLYNIDNLIPFFHDGDQCILLKDNTLWVHPNHIKDALQFPLKDTILVAPQISQFWEYPYEMLKDCAGVCTDYPESLKHSIIFYKENE